MFDYDGRVSVAQSLPFSRPFFVLVKNVKTIGFGTLTLIKNDQKSFLIEQPKEEMRNKKKCGEEKIIAGSVGLEQRRMMMVDKKGNRSFWFSEM
jgi:hypothetical protein